MLDLSPQDLPPESAYHQVTGHNFTNTLNFSVVFSEAGFCLKSVASIIKIPPKEEKVYTYSELPRTKEDEGKIEDLISSLGKHGKVSLLFNHQTRLRKIGDEVRYIHPFKFLGYIFSHENLKKHMVSIFEDYFKRTNFVDGISETFDIYDLSNRLFIYLDDFCSEINISPDEIREFLVNKDWSNLVKYLVYR